jgi:S-adenosylmethionine:diacylglycerol 3-amino-3-carboxypropyl transferase
VTLPAAGLLAACSPCGLTPAVEGAAGEMCGSFAGLAGISSTLRYDFFLNASLRHLLYALFSKAKFYGPHCIQVLDYNIYHVSITGVFSPKFRGETKRGCGYGQPRFL